MSEDFQAFLSSNPTEPPSGPVIDADMSGPPMLRMIVMQMAFGAITNMGGAPKWIKTLVIIIICAGFTYRDFDTFMTHRNPNLYESIGTYRGANTTQIEEIFNNYKLCEDEFELAPCDTFNRGIYRVYNMTEMGAIRRVLLVRPDLRELYDKQEIFIRKPYENSPLQPQYGQSYISSVGELANYAIFVIMMAFYVEKHQNFAKQMTISSLMLFCYISVSLRLPREDSKDPMTDNWVIKVFEYFPMFDRFTFFEINFLIKHAIYGNVYHTILNISRLVDYSPEVTVKARILDTQRECTRALMLCELVTDSQGTIKERRKRNKEEKTRLRLEEREKQRQAEFEEAKKHKELLVKQKNEEVQLDTQLEKIDSPDKLNEDTGALGTLGSLGTVNPTWNDEVPQAVIQAKEEEAAKYGTADPDILDTYDYCCEFRKKFTIDFMTKRFQTKFQQDQETSKFVKFGRILQKIVIVLVIGAMVGPMIMGIYQQFQSANEAHGEYVQQGRHERANTNRPKTPEEAREMAMEKERARQARANQFRDDHGIDDSDLLDEELLQEAGRQKTTDEDINVNKKGKEKTQKEKDKQERIEKIKREEREKKERLENRKNLEQERKEKKLQEEAEKKAKRTADKTTTKKEKSYKTEEDKLQEQRKKVLELDDEEFDD